MSGSGIRCRIVVRAGGKRSFLVRVVVHLDCVVNITRDFLFLKFGSGLRLPSVVDVKVVSFLDILDLVVLGNRVAEFLQVRFKVFGDCSFVKEGVFDDLG